MTTTPKRSFLVVDNDVQVLQKVEKTLLKNDFEANLATDGALAINRAIATPPVVVISAVEMPLLDGFKLCQLLRTNPLTKDIPFLFLTSKETSPQRLGKYLRPFDEFLLKPFKEEDLVGHINSMLVRMEKVEEASSGQQQALLGTLSEITLMDLLQILRMNRRSGALELEQGGRLGTVSINEGEVINAKLGNFSGEKAFFRLLDWNKGKFEFHPRNVETEVLITRPGENLILDGLRQLDEVNKLKEDLAGSGRKVELVKQFQGPQDKLKPVTRDVLKLLNYFSSLEDVLDQSSFNDLEICQTVQVLVEKKIVQLTSVEEKGAKVEDQPLLSLENALKLSYQLGVGREETQQAWTGKILLFAHRRKLLQQLLEGLSKLRDFKIEASIVLGQTSKNVPLGSVGSIQILEGTDLTIYCFSSEPSYRPLWEPLSQGALGSIIVVEGEELPAAAAKFCDDALRQPFLFCGPGFKGEKKEGLDWEPKVPWGTTVLKAGDEGSCGDVFKKLFELILSR